MSIGKKDLIKDIKYQNIIWFLDKHVEYMHERIESFDAVKKTIISAKEIFGEKIANELIKEFELKELKDI